MFPTIYLASLGNLDLDPLWPHSEHLGHASCQDPAEVGEATQLQPNAGVVGRPHHHQLQELNRVQRGHDLIIIFSIIIMSTIIIFIISIISIIIIIIIIIIT